MIDTLAQAMGAAESLAFDPRQTLDPSSAGISDDWIALGLTPAFANDTVVMVHRATGEALVVSRWAHLSHLGAMRPLTA